MASWYEELGASPSANQEELRRAYRRRARALHPDVNAGVVDDSAMQRLNAAWAVLGEPTSRRRYDDQQRQAAGSTLPPRPVAPPVSRPDDDPTASESAPAAVGFRLRPSMIILVVLFLIFVVTAYAGHPGATGTAPSPSPITTSTGADSPVTVPVRAFVGHCIRDQSGSISLVPCSQRPNSLVIATMPAAGTCPSGTASYYVAGQSQMLCAQPSGP